MIVMMADGRNDQDRTGPGLIGRFFSRRSDSARNVSLLAFQVREGIERINPFIQESTATVCPSCRDVCCRNKHGYHNDEDLIYLSALGVEPPQNHSGRQDAAPCHFLAETGCSLERTLRPSGCTWYFCDSLYDHMEKRPGYAEFDRALGRLAELWMQMTEEFRKLMHI